MIYFKIFLSGTKDVNAFSKLYKNENNLLVLPVKLIPKVLKHLVHEELRGTLIIPVWKSSSFWSILTDERCSWIIKDNKTINEGQTYSNLVTVHFHY